MTDETPSQGLLACPLCGSDKVEVDCYARTNEGVCTEPSINCDGCGTIFTFDFNAADPWHEIARRWNTRAPIASIPEPDMRGDVVERVALERIASGHPDVVAAMRENFPSPYEIDMEDEDALRRLLDAIATAAIDAACPRHE